ncbi:MAG: prolyl oligopeptidase family serine peptidase [Actinobacteria bacterium]|nr:prolyl oligopeptidase family serine peptidase [Actinomycetota bacterium]
MRATLLMLLSLLLVGCAHREEAESLTESRRGFQTKIIRQSRPRKPLPQPPPELFRVVRYDSPVGKLAAYLSQPPADGNKHPAIVWIFGGPDNSIGDTAWDPAPSQNDQSASAFRKAGIVTMYPSLRGSHDNPGLVEGLFGEVDDVVGAADFLAQQESVDPERIYLGGHSTGGTLALLAAASTDRFRAVFSFGPVDDVSRYGSENLPFDSRDKREVKLRAPVHWLHSVRSPLDVFEGTNGNLSSLLQLQSASRNPMLRFHPVKGADHFSVLAPVTTLIAQKIGQDSGQTSNIQFNETELNELFSR